MNALIWMLTWLPHVLPAMSELPRPVNATLSSKHFRHSLTWEPGPGTPAGVCYQVAVQAENESSQKEVAGCECVQHPLACNLAEAFPDQNQRYHTWVTALLQGQASQPASPRSPFDQGFLPARDTLLDLPLLAVTPCEKNLCVDLQPPVEQLRDFYKSLHYRLRIESSTGRGEQETTLLRREILKNLAPGRRYCVSICFSDSLVPRKSNYSGPVCAFTKAQFTADPVISSVLCLLVLLGLAVAALLVSAGYTCLTKRRLPLVLTSIHHLEEVLVVAPSSASLSTLLNFKPTPPSSGGKRNSQTSSDESDGESETEDPGESGGGRGGGGYKLRKGTDLLSSSSSSSSSLSAPSPPEAEPTLSSSSSEQTSDLVTTRTLGQTSTETHSGGGLKDTLSSHTHSPPDPPADSLTGGGIRPEEDSQDVNLLTLTFGRHEEEEEEGEEEDKLLHVESPFASEKNNTTANLLTQARDSKEAAGETVSCSVEEEEEDEEEEEEEEEEEDDEDEDSGYLRRR